MNIVDYNEELKKIKSFQSHHENESFENGLLEHPLYTRPREIEGHAIPEVLLSGNHSAIEKWKLQKSEEITKERRPDLWEKYKQSD